MVLASRQAYVIEWVIVKQAQLDRRIRVVLYQITCLAERCNLVVINGGDVIADLNSSSFSSALRLQARHDKPHRVR